MIYYTFEHNLNVNHNTGLYGHRYLLKFVFNIILWALEIINSSTLVGKLEFVNMYLYKTSITVENIIIFCTTSKGSF